MSEIETLPPPPPPAVAGVPLSERTGEPRRGWEITIATTLAVVAGAWMAVATLVTLYRAAVRWPASAAMIGWAEARPGSTASVLLAVAMAAIGAAVVTGAGVLAYNTWEGHEWVRWVGLAAVVTSLLTILLDPLSQVTIAFLVPAAVLVWLPGARAVFRAFETHRKPPVRPTDRPETVAYGPLPRYR